MGASTSLLKLGPAPQQAEGDILCGEWGAYTCHRPHVAVTRQPFGVGSPPPACLRQGLFCGLLLSMLG